MMAAITAARLNQSVILIEKNAELGRKILATGNGRCNLTNKLTDVSRFHGGNPEFIKQVLDSFNQFETMAFFEDLGLILKEENLGRVFPRSDQASSVVNALIHELETLKVDVVLDDQVRRLEKIDIFKLTLQSGKSIESTKLIVTTGGQAAQQLGTSGDAYFWLKNLGHTVTELYPALAPLETEETWVKEVQGLKVEANVSTTINSKKVYEKTGDALFTHFGLSGPAAMAQAGAMGQFIGKAQVKVHLDLFPEETLVSLDSKLTKIMEASSAKQLKNVLTGLIPSNLAPVILDQIGVDKDRKAAEISKIDRQKISATLKNIELTIKNTKAFKDAQVTHGGVNLNEVDAETMESEIVPNLYFAGEILDVDGDSGGFNLQWAWSSGHLASQSCSK